MPDLLEELRRYGDAVAAAALDHDRRAYVAAAEPLDRGRRVPRRAVLIGIAAAVLVTLVVSIAVLVRDDDHDSVRIDTPPTPVSPPSTEVRPVEPPVLATVLPASDARWTALDPGPLRARDGYSAVWTGDRMIVWGGGNPEIGPLFSDGAVYHPESDTWATLPESPLTARAWHLGAWTGEEMVLWGGGASRGRLGDPVLNLLDGAAFKPETGAWRRLAASPLPAGPRYSGAWTGEQLVVIGATEEGAHAASYEPRTDSWRLLSPSDFQLAVAWSELQVEWTGERVVAVENNPQIAGVTVLVYDPATDTWSTSPWPGALAQAVDSAVMDGQLYIAGYGQSREGTMALDPVTGLWSSAVSLGDLSCEGFPELVPLEGQLFFDHCGRSGIFDPAAQTWQQVDGLPLQYRLWTSVLWTGDRLLAWFPGTPAETPNYPEQPAGFLSLTP